MKPLSPEATAVMQEILSGISNVGDHKKLNNNPSFMPLCVECIGTCREGKLFSLAHYGLLNGDAIRGSRDSMGVPLEPDDPEDAEIESVKDEK